MKSTQIEGSLVLNREYLRAIAINTVNNTPFPLVSLIYLYDEIYRYNEFDAKFSGCGDGGW